MQHRTNYKEKAQKNDTIQSHACCIPKDVDGWQVFVDVSIQVHALEDNRDGEKDCHPCMPKGKQINKMHTQGAIKRKI